MTCLLGKAKELPLFSEVWKDFPPGKGEKKSPELEGKLNNLSQQK